MKAEIITFKFLIKKEKYWEFYHQIKNMPGYLDHTATTLRKDHENRDCEVYDYRGMEVNFDDWEVK